ncbi:hypothetical protein [Pedobacter sp.]|uniref:hypothetical protein n=1 Tax=Pedobacter sp. TaxID=1411316 RepID=UPI00396CC5CB
MEIKYLKYLRDNSIKRGLDMERINQPTPIAEIEQLESIYNNGNSFPQELRELLFLAGNSCYVIDMGRNETQQQMQEHVRSRLARNSKSINRPFYAIDVYHPSDQMLFIYLDEIGLRPIVWNAVYEEPIDEWLVSTGRTITDLITSRIDRVKEGMNPF